MIESQKSRVHSSNGFINMYRQYSDFFPAMIVSTKPTSLKSVTAKQNSLMFVVTR